MMVYTDALCSDGDFFNTNGVAIIIKCPSNRAQMADDVRVCKRYSKSYDLNILIRMSLHGVLQNDSSRALCSTESTSQEVEHFTAPHRVWSVYCKRRRWKKEYRVLPDIFREQIPTLNATFVGSLSAMELTYAIRDIQRWSGNVPHRDLIWKKQARSASRIIASSYDRNIKIARCLRGDSTQELIGCN